MDSIIGNLKANFQKIIDKNKVLISTFDKLEVKISNITNFYIELIDKNKDKMYLFGLDSLKFQIALLDREKKETTSFFKAVHNRIYCEYYKLCKKICEYTLETFPGTNLINIAKTIDGANLPIYDAVDPEKEYSFSFVLTIHDNIIELLKNLNSFLLNKEHELKSHSEKKTMGLNIDNFVVAFSYNNFMMKEKIAMFLHYINFFHEMHLKNLCLIQKKLSLMNSEIDNDLKFDDDDKPPLALSINPQTKLESNETSTPESLRELVSHDDGDAKEGFAIDLQEKEENISDTKV
jgi:translation elongation factor EF-G